MADKLTELTDAYFEKFGDYPPMHVNHGLDPKGALQDALDTGIAIPSVLPGNTPRDNF
jgi:hypothetical protein